MTLSTIIKSSTFTMQFETLKTVEVKNCRRIRNNKNNLVVK